MVARAISGVAGDMVELVRCFVNGFFVRKCRFCGCVGGGEGTVPGRGGQLQHGLQHKEYV